MGANFFADMMLPAVDTKARSASEDSRVRQVEIFTQGQAVFLRMGEIDEKHGGGGSCVELTPDTANNLVEGLAAAMRYLSWPKR